MSRFLLFVVFGMILVASMANVGLAQKESQEMVVLSNNTPLKRGEATLAILPAGYRFKVLRTEGEWLGARVSAEGREVTGWVWQRQAGTPQHFAQRQAANRNRYSNGYRGPNPYARNTLPSDMGDYRTGGLRSGSPLIMGDTQYGQGYWRADRKEIGE